MGDHIHRVDPLMVEHAGNAGLGPGREDLALLPDLPQSAATRGLIFDQRGERFLAVAQGGREYLAARLASEKRIFRGRNSGLCIAEKR